MTTRRRRPIATSRWCSRTTRCTRTSRCARTSRSGCASGGRRATRSSGGWRRWRRCSGSRSCWRRRPAQLSGGQRQRVAMGRALVREPQAFLLDEPLSNLDAKLRTTMRAELARLHERLGVTTVYVTHDQVEAMTLGQRVGGAARRRAAAVRRAAGAVPAAGEPVRRGVHRLAADEPRRRARSTATASRSRATRCRCPAGSRRARSCSGMRPGGVRARRAARRSGAGRGWRSRPRSSRSSATRRVVTFRIDAPPVQADAVKAATDDVEEGRLLADDRAARFSARLRGRVDVALRRPRSRSPSTTASCTCSTRPTAGRCAQTTRTSRASWTARAPSSRPAPGTSAFAAAVPVASASAAAQSPPTSSAVRKPPSAASPLPTG